MHMNNSLNNFTLEFWRGLWRPHLRRAPVSQCPVVLRILFIIQQTVSSAFCSTIKTIANIRHAAAAGTQETDTFALILFYRPLNGITDTIQIGQPHQLTGLSSIVWTTTFGQSLSHWAMQGNMDPPIKDSERRPTFCKGHYDQCSVHKHGVGQMLRHPNRLGLLELHKTHPRCHWHGGVTGKIKIILNKSPSVHSHTCKNYNYGLKRVSLYYIAAYEILFIKIVQIKMNSSDKHKAHKQRRPPSP